MGGNDFGMNAVTTLITHREHENFCVPLYGVKVEDDNENDFLIGACVDTSVLVTDKFACIMNFVNVRLGKVYFSHR